MVNKPPLASFPLHLYRPKGKPIAISLSWYRIAHFRSLNSAKKRFTEELALPQLKSQGALTPPVFMLFVLYVENKRRRDLDNLIAVQKKFFMDAFVKAKVIDEDHVFNVPLFIDCFGGIEKDKPRVDVYAFTNFDELIETTRNKLWQPN